MHLFPGPMLNLAGVIIAFIIILVLIRKRVNFGLSLIFGSIIIGVFSLEVITPIDIPKTMIEATFYSFETHQVVTSTTELALLMTLIFVLAKCMQETGAIDALINTLRTFFSKGGTLGVIPAVYGLMPNPGGSLFSAPMVDNEGNKYHLNKDQKNFLNIWFRHIWFPIYPISQAMIIICSINFSDIPMGTLILANFVGFIAFVLIGFLYLRRFVGPHPKPEDKTPRNYHGLIFILPPVVPLLFYPLTYLGLSETRCFLLGVSVSIILLYLLTKSNWDTYRRMVKKSLTLKLAFAVFGIIIFQEMFKASQVHTLIQGVMSSIAFPALIIIIVIPFLLGLLTGSDFGALVPLSYSLVAPFFPFTGVSLLGLTSLLFISSFLGYLISPIHLCNVLSSDYLKTDTTRMYKFFIPAVITTLLVQVVFVVFVFRI
jgi:integral membrane protein (TIGR00529 family)